LAAGVACAIAGCGGLYTKDPHKVRPTDADVPRLDGNDGNVPVDTAPAIDERPPAVDARPALEVGASATKSIGAFGDKVELGPASYKVPDKAFSGKTAVMLTLISLDGSPDKIRPGAIGPVFQIAIQENRQVNGSSFALAAPRSLGYPADRLAIASYDQYGNWNPYETYYDDQNDSLWATLWPFSGTRIVGVLLRCKSDGECPSPLTCKVSDVCQ
jgi:hypothetical protein